MDGANSYWGAAYEFGGDDLRHRFMLGLSAAPMIEFKTGRLWVRIGMCSDRLDSLVPGEKRTLAPSPIRQQAVFRCVVEMVGESHLDAHGKLAPAFGVPTRCRFEIRVRKIR